MKNRWLLLFLHIISLVLLGLGWVLDMLHINVGTHFIVDVSLFDEKRSVLGTLENLWKSNNYWPFALIFLFGIVVPILKSILVGYLLVAKEARPAWYTFVNAISKWAMADVFAISIFIAFLGANAMESTHANLEAGFYYFAGYVLLSGIVTMLLGKMMKERAISNA